MAKETIKQLVKRLNQSTLQVRKKGKKYCVRDVVEMEFADSHSVCMSAKKLRKEFG